MKKNLRSTPIDIAILGPENTFSDLAAQKYNRHLNRYFCQSISEIFNKVIHGLAKEGLVPIEVAGQGLLSETIDELFASALYIKQVIIFPIIHCLATLPSSNFQKIKVILSREQALAQCSHFLHTNFPHATLIRTTSTTEAMQRLVRENKTEAAAIGSKQAAIELGLKILTENIGNNQNNKTKFIVISKKKPIFPNNKNTYSAISFYFSQNKPGSLFLVLKAFACEQINLTKIESYARGKEFGEYVFFIEFKGSLLNPQVKKTLKTIQLLVAKLKIYGSFEIIEI
jgi:prephenate dehydratase